MATETITPPQTSPPPAPRKIHRVQIGINVLVQAALIFLLVAMVNYLGFEHYKRWDLSRDKKYSLSDKTKRFLETINGKVRMTVFFGGTNPISQDVQNLLTAYQYAAKGKIDVEYIDPERSLSRAKEIFEKHKVVTDESVVIVDYEGRNKTVKASEMAEVDQGNPMLGEAPKVTAFKGEQAITSALIDLVEGKKNTVGYVLGHKEPALADEAPSISPMMTPEQGQRSPISVLKTSLENENIQLSELNLFDVPSIPEEMKTIMILGPQYDLSDREMQLLREFWDKGGRILLLLDPAAKMPRLHGFLNELGVRVNDDRLMAMVRTGIQEVALIRDVQARFLDTPITKRLAEARGLFFGGTSSLTLEEDRVRAANIRLQPLVQAERGYWAEKDYNSPDQEKLQENAAANQGAIHTIAASVEKGGSGDERVQANSSRMVVVTNATFVQDNALTQDQQGLDFVSGAVNWLLSREQLIGIAPKVQRTLTFHLDDEALSRLKWLILVLMPLVPAVIGGAVWWQRRA
ncbi:MAG TPA: GldG family protein [Chthoniobacterales bacterium]|nr:GldG family protein [Chthoniobacterales bacterium]